MTVNKLLDMLARHYKLEGRATLTTYTSHAKHLRRILGSLEAGDLTYEHLEDYKEQGLEDRRARKTINNELCFLRRALRLARKRRLVRDIIDVELFQKADKPREGFLEPEEFRKLLEHINDFTLRDIATFAYHSGWRKSEILGLTWAEVSLRSRMITLPPARTKNSDPKYLPISGEIEKVIARRDKENMLYDSPSVFVFTRNGAPVKNFYCAWNSACKRAGFPGLRLHDCRRSFARNATNAGVDQKTIMVLGGWRTDAMFRRYNIRNEGDLRRAAERIGRAVKEE